MTVLEIYLSIALYVVLGLRFADWSGQRRSGYALAVLLWPVGLLLLLVQQLIFAIDRWTRGK